jgi:hypothetical protein
MNVSLVYRAALLLALSHACGASAALQIDGRANEPEWQRASVVPALRLTQPDTGELPDFQTEVRWMALPSGLAVHFTCYQDATRYPRRAPRQQRDRLGDSDRVNLMFDLNGDGQTGYNVTVSRANSVEDATISNENLFNSDWDSFWYHATAELPDDKGWSAEILIPWSSTLMRATEGATRTIGLYFDRVIGSEDLRAAHPNLFFFRPQFLSLFAKAEIAQYSQSLLKLYPYVTTQFDIKNSDRTFRTGFDLFWKPSASLQLTAAVNPDFGQVESDDLVVNFEAVEIFFSDKRPFFTENQSIFVLQSPEQDSLIYTRRAGGNRDDGKGISDIDAASKLSGSIAGFDYGMFVVAESDRNTVGRSIAAFRTVRPNIALGDGAIDVGYLGSYVDRPFLDRKTDVHSVDLRWERDRLQIDAVALTSRPNRGLALLNSGRAPGQAASNGTGGWLRARYRPSSRMDVAFDYTRFDADVDINDLGFQRRNNLSLYEFSPRLRFEGLDGWLGLRSAQLNLDIDVQENARNQLLSHRTELGSDLFYQNGSTGYVEIAYRGSGIDDLISRGNGDLAFPTSRSIFFFHDSTRLGRWQYSGEIYFERGGLKKDLLFLEPSLRFFATDDLNFRFGLSATNFSERVLWRSGTLFGRFEKTEGATLRVDAEWFSGEQHELRLKTELLSISGKNPTALTLQRNRQLLASSQTVAPFSIQNFGLQLRYRYKINAESDFFAVYSRGGSSDEATFRRAFDQLDDTLSLRDSDQVLFKLRYAF